MEKFVIAASTDIGSVRTINQDSLFINGKCVFGADTKSLTLSVKVPSDKRIIISVFDGLGGMSHGEVASETACKTLSEWYEKHSDNESLDICSYFEEANGRICELNRGHHERMGSTCNILEYYRGKLIFSNIGDSRSYLFRKGDLIQLSEDHNELNTFKKVRQDSGNDDIMTSDVKNTLTQYLGIFPDEFIIDPHIAPPIEFVEGDICMLCSDGLTSFVDDASIASILSSPSSLKAKCNELTSTALKNGGTDNITIILFGENNMVKNDSEPGSINIFKKIFQRLF